MKVHLKIEDQLLSYPKSNYFLVSEKLNTDNVFEYIEYKENIWLVDAEDSIYVVVINGKEFTFYILNIEFDDELEDIKEFLLTNEIKIEDYLDISLQNIGNDIGYTMKVFNTMYKIMLDNFKTSFFFRADNKETSRVKLYHTIAKFIEKENDHIRLATVINDDYHSEEQYNLLETLKIDNMTRKKMFSEVEMYTYFVFEVNND